MQNTEKMFGGGSKNIISNEGREKGTRESEMKRSEIFRHSSVPGFFLNVVPITHFSMF